MALNHIIFVDNLLIFLKANTYSSKVIKAGMDIFSSLSGLRINNSKSQLYFGGTSFNIKQEISGILNITQGVLPVRYLGVTLSSKKLSIEDLKQLMDNISEAINHWINKLLTYAGSFLWKGNLEGAREAKVAWSNVCKPKAGGGLNIPDIECLNKAHTNILQGNCIWSIKVKKDLSWTWKKILKVRDLSYQLVTHEIRDGSNTFVFWDNWIDVNNGGSQHMLWSKRNAQIYNGKKSNEEQILHSVQSFLHTKLSNCRKFKDKDNRASIVQTWQLLVREKDVCWEYAEKLEGNKVKCKFCLRILNGGISRLKHHLSKLPSKGVNPCAKVRDDVSERVRDIISSKDEIKEVPHSKRQKLIEPKSPLNHSVTKPPLMTLEQPSPIAKKILYPSNDQESAERSIALFFFENKLDFRVARSSSYQSMIDTLGKCRSVIVPPSAESLKTTWLDRIKSELSLESKDVEKEWNMTGCTIIAETWTDNKSRAMINFLVSSPSKTFFHKSVDASLYYKNVKCLSELFDSVIQEFGSDNVVQIIVDTALISSSLVNHILQNYGTIFISPCASQCLNSILEEFSKVDWVNRCIIQAQGISKFIYNNSSVLDLMKQFTGGQDVIRTGVTKSVSNFLSLQTMLKHKSRLKHMFNSPDFSTDSPFASKTCTSNVEDDNFWRMVEECVAISEPFLKVMREVSNGKPALGFIYELMTRATESVRTYFIMDEVKCKTFLDIVDKNWHSNLHSPLHSAAAFLNPGIQYNPEIKFIASIKEDFLRVLEKLLPRPELRLDITNQLISFGRATGMFGCTLAKEAIDSVSPGIWWEQYGDGAPALQRVAIRILSQVCSSYSYERQWSPFQQIQPDKRNKIEKVTLNDVVYINYNLKLAKSLTSSESSLKDPLQLDDVDMTCEWVEEGENSSTTQWLDRFGSTLEGNDSNIGAALFGSNDHIFGL